MNKTKEIIEAKGGISLSLIDNQEQVIYDIVIDKQTLLHFVFSDGALIVSLIRKEVTKITITTLIRCDEDAPFLATLIDWWLINVEYLLSKFGLVILDKIYTPMNLTFSK